MIPPGACSGKLEQYGTGLAGFAGTTPTISGPCPLTGLPFVVDFAGGRPGALGRLAHGTAAASTPFFGGALLLQANWAFSHVLHGGSAATLPMAAPNDPNLVGMEFYLQAGYVDRNAPQGIALTGDLEATVGGRAATSPRASGHREP